MPRFYVDVRVIGRADRLVIQRHEFKTERAALDYVQELAVTNARGGDHSGYEGEFIATDAALPAVDLCKEV